MFGEVSLNVQWQQRQEKVRVEVISKPTYLEDDEFEVTYKITNPNAEITDMLMDFDFNDSFCYVANSFLYYIDNPNDPPQPGDPVLVTDGDWAADVLAKTNNYLSLADTADGSRGFTLPSGVCYIRFKVKIPALSSLEDEIDQDGQSTGDKEPLIISHSFFSGMDDPCMIASMNEIDGIKIVPYGFNTRTALTVFLEGPIAKTISSLGTDSAYMTNYLQTGGGFVLTPKLPLQNPYNPVGTYYSKINTTATPVGKVVDWIWVEIWDNTKLALMTAPTVLESQALLLHSDGTIVDTTGNAPKFTTQTNSVRIVVKHRNHLVIMSDSIFLFDGTPIEYDFSAAQTKAYNIFGLNPMALKTGKYCMWAGDFNDDAAVNYQDELIFRADIGIMGIYVKPDINMDGIVDYQDELLFNKNNGLTSPIFFFK
jgi:hypothetical protein